MCLAYICQTQVLVSMFDSSLAVQIATMHGSFVLHEPVMDNVFGRVG